MSWRENVTGRDSYYTVESCNFVTRRGTFTQSVVGEATTVRSLRMTQDGALAWTAQRPGRSGITWVYKNDADGVLTLAASGAIPPLSLAVGANEAYWTQDGASRRHPLTKLKGRTSNPNRTYCQRAR